MVHANSQIFKIMKWHKTPFFLEICVQAFFFRVSLTVQDKCRLYSTCTCNLICTLRHQNLLVRRTPLKKNDITCCISSFFLSVNDRKKGLQERCSDTLCDLFFYFLFIELSLQEDVAGATFMAAGSSAPEFFTALIGTY